VLDRLGLQADFKLSYERLKTDLAAKLDCCNAVLNSATLRRFAHLMLQVGNVLNEVNYFVPCVDCRVIADVLLTIKLLVIYVGIVILEFS